jgi:hypothetical protein
MLLDTSKCQPRRVDRVDGRGKLEDALPSVSRRAVDEAGLSQRTQQSATGHVALQLRGFHRVRRRHSRLGVQRRCTGHGIPVCSCTCCQCSAVFGAALHRIERSIGRPTVGDEVAHDDPPRASVSPPPSQPAQLRLGPPRPSTTGR